MTDIENLRAEYEKATDAAQKLTVEKDEAVQEVMDKYRDRQREANQKAADSQNLLCDTEVHLALQDRPDRDAVAAKLRGEAENALTAAIVQRSSRPDGTLDVKAYEAEVAELRERANTLGFDHLPFYTSAE